MRVGTRNVPFLLCFTVKDHPHACGDKAVLANFLAINTGSSPCVWGQAYLRLHRRIERRIIPMRVGTRSVYGMDIQQDKDHPHACGDKQPLFL